MRFVKMHGIGNDYVYFDCFRQPVPGDPAALARRVADRHFGVGGDGIVLIVPPDDPAAHARMRMFNADGSEAEMCGNAIRCVAKYIHDEGIAPHAALTIETGRGPLRLELELRGGKTERVRVDMRPPILRAAEIPTTLPGHPPLDVPLDGCSRAVRATCVSMGNPHAVVFLDEEPDDAWVLGIGPLIERQTNVFPRGVNAEFAYVRSPREVSMRVWERGSGETWGCGTGACAVAVAGILTGRLERRATVKLRGGDLDIEWPAAGASVFMTGPATEVFRGELSV